MSKYLSITTTSKESVWINIDNIVSIKVSSSDSGVIDILTNAVDIDGDNKVYHVRGSLPSLMASIGASVVAF